MVDTTTLFAARRRELLRKASMLLEMLLLRDGLLYKSALARVELKDMIYEISVG